MGDGAAARGGGEGGMRRLEGAREGWETSALGRGGRGRRSGAVGIAGRGAGGGLEYDEGADGRRRPSPACGAYAEGGKDGVERWGSERAVIDDGACGITRVWPDGRDGNTRPPTRVGAGAAGGALKPCLADSRKSAAACASSRNGLGGAAGGAEISEEGGGEIG